MYHSPDQCCSIVIQSHLSYEFISFSFFNGSLICSLFFSLLGSVVVEFFSFCGERGRECARWSSYQADIYFFAPLKNVQALERCWTTVLEIYTKVRMNVGCVVSCNERWVTRIHTLHSLFAHISWLLRLKGDVVCGQLNETLSVFAGTSRNANNYDTTLSASVLFKPPKLASATQYYTF